jgi:hypothetical protein
MSTVKITQLPVVNIINANTANTLFVGVDVPTDITFQMTATTLAQGLYSNNILNVGVNPVLFTNTIAQFSSSDPAFLQVNLQNFNSNGSGDYIVTADTGTNANSYIDLGINNSQFSGSVQFSSMNPYDGYLYVHGPSDTATKGNLIIGTASANANVLFIVGNTQAQNIVATLTKTGLVLNTQSYITFSDGTKQSTAWPNSSSAVANSASANTIYTQGVDATQNTNIQLAWNLANTSLQNTSTITTNNNIIVTGNLTSNTSNTIAWFSQVKIQGGQNGLTINNSSFSANTALVRIDGSNGFAAQTPTANGYMLQIQGLDGVPTRLAIDSSGVNGTGNAYSLLVGRAARGTAASPTSPQSGDLLFRIAGNGYGTTGYAVQNGGAVIDWIALDNFTDTTKGTQLNVSTTIVGSNVRTVAASFNANTVYFANTVTPANGIINTVRVGSASPLTINFTTDTIVRANLSANFTVTPASFVAGKTIDVWLTNTSSGAGSTHTITHGVSALNSTVGATTFSLAGTQSARLKYMCADGTSANTFCAITYQ